MVGYMNDGIPWYFHFWRALNPHQPNQTFFGGLKFYSLPILDTLQKNKSLAGERRYSYWYQKTS